MEQWVVIFTSAGPGQATIIREALAAAGIPAELTRESAGAAYGLTVGPLGLVDVLVPPDRVEEAQALLAEAGWTSDEDEQEE
jgi:hypothetical protein